MELFNYNILYNTILCVVLTVTILRLQRVCIPATLLYDAIRNYVKHMHLPSVHLEDEDPGENMLFHVVSPG